ncbi:MAG: TIGR02281 family clan AA aspartic protease [Alphaproteobacteria bacterium]
MGGWRRWGAWIIAALAIAATALLVVLLVQARPGALAHQDNQIRLTGLVAMLAWVASGLFLGHQRISALRWIRHGAVWLALGILLVLGYSFRSDVTGLWNRMLAELIPGRAVQTAPGTVTVRQSQGGHFRVDVLVEGVSLHMLVDTGATLVTLSPADAKRIGIDLDRLIYSQRFRTANGEVLGAAIRLREIRIGPIVLRNVRASVNRAPMDASLLGQSFLNRLGGYTVKNGQLTLTAAGGN